MVEVGAAGTGGVKTASAQGLQADGAVERRLRSPARLVAWTVDAQAHLESRGFLSGTGMPMAV